MRSFVLSLRKFLDGLFELLRGVWSDPVARAVILWLIGKFVPGVKDLAISRVQRLSKRADTLRMPRPDIQTADDKIREMGLYVPHWFWGVPQPTRDKMCNGMGPDCFGERVRNLINSLGACVIWCSFIHDPAFYLPYNDGTYETWQRDTQELWEINSSICVAYANLKCNWWGRVRNQVVADIITAVLKAGAYDAYVKAFKRGEKVV